MSQVGHSRLGRASSKSERCPLCSDIEQIPHLAEMTRWATSELMHRSKQPNHSPTSSAGTSSVGGTSMSSAHDCAEHCSGVRGFVVRRLYDVSEMALLSHILYDWRSPNHLILRPQMLDNPKKTEPLLVALKAAVPFEVELMPALIEHLRVKNIATLNEIRQTVSDVSYAGDEGGIVCHIVPSDIREALVVSLTHVRMPRTMPLASAVIDYQKHRVKKLKKQR